MEPPYYAVIFTSQRTGDDEAGYAETARAMEALATGRPGYLGIESARGTDGAGITISYWRDLEAVKAWRADAEHLAAQRLGRERWYARYRVRVARVERDYAANGG